MSLKVEPFLLMSLLYIHATKGECPQMDKIPVMFNNVTFMCMNVWHKWGDDLPVNACNGAKEDISDNWDYDPGGGFYNGMGSIMVKPGCTAYLFKDYHFTGESLVVQGPNATYNNKWGIEGENPQYPNGPKSFKCRCLQKPVDCKPIDDYDTILLCDNTQGVAPTKCTYSHTIGTK